MQPTDEHLLHMSSTLTSISSDEYWLMRGNLGDEVVWIGFDEAGRTIWSSMSRRVFNSVTAGVDYASKMSNPEVTNIIPVRVIERTINYHDEYTEEEWNEKLNASRDAFRSMILDR